MDFMNIKKFLMIINLFILVIITDLVNCRETQSEILRGVTIRNWPYADRLSGRYEGFAVDLMNEISNIAGFEFRLYFSPDGKYGAVQDNKINGMIGEVFNNRAEFAIGDLTVTDIRKKYVDFTEPFMDNGLSVLIHKSNIGNMKTFEDLANQNHIKYGTYRMGSTYNNFSQSTDPTIKKMFLEMARNPDVLVNDAKEGVDRVNSSRYAFIIETSFAEFLSGMYCNLTYIEDNRFSRQYAIALSKESPHKESFNNAIRKMKRNGMINRLKDKYWKKCNDFNNNSVDNKDKVTNIEWAHKGYDVSAFYHNYCIHKVLYLFISLSVFKYCFI